MAAIWKLELESKCDRQKRKDEWKLSSWDYLRNALTVLKKIWKKFSKKLDTSLYHFAKGFVDILHSF